MCREVGARRELRVQLGLQNRGAGLALVACARTYSGAARAGRATTDAKLLRALDDVFFSFQARMGGAGGSVCGCGCRRRWRRTSLRGRPRLGLRQRRGDRDTATGLCLSRALSLSVIRIPKTNHNKGSEPQLYTPRE